MGIIFAFVRIAFRIVFTTVAVIATYIVAMAAAIGFHTVLKDIKASDNTEPKK